jgi:hypothetical protein
MERKVVVSKRRANDSGFGNRTNLAFRFARSSVSAVIFAAANPKTMNSAAKLPPHQHASRSNFFFGFNATRPVHQTTAKGAKRVTSTEEAGVCSRCHTQKSRRYPSKLIDRGVGGASCEP